MTTTKRVLSLGLAAILVAAAPLAAFTLIEDSQKLVVTRGETFSIQVTFPQAVHCKGTHTKVMSANVPFRLDVLSMGDGSVRASFFDRTGQSFGETNGVIAIIRKGDAALKQAPAGPPGGNAAFKGGAAGEAKALNFAKLGLGPNSRTRFETQGQKANLEILSGDGNHHILIGLLLPAVQKVREAAAKPH